MSEATDDQAPTVEELTATLERARDRADATESAANRVAEATAEQAETVETLEARVGDLRT